jgi:phosphocarrier protein
VLALGVGIGETITLSVEGDNADGVADELEAMLASDLDAD